MAEVLIYSGGALVPGGSPPREMSTSGILCTNNAVDDPWAIGAGQGQDVLHGGLIQSGAHDRRDAQRSTLPGTPLPRSARGFGASIRGGGAEDGRWMD